MYIVVLEGPFFLSFFFCFPTTTAVLPQKTVIKLFKATSRSLDPPNLDRL